MSTQVQVKYYGVSVEDGCGDIFEGTVVGHNDEGDGVTLDGHDVFSIFTIENNTIKYIEE